MRVSGVLGQEQDWQTTVKLLNDKHFLKTMKTFDIYELFFIKIIGSSGAKMPKI